MTLVLTFNAVRCDVFIACRSAGTGNVTDGLLYWSHRDGRSMPGETLALRVLGSLEVEPLKARGDIINMVANRSRHRISRSSVSASRHPLGHFNSILLVTRDAQVSCRLVYMSVVFGFEQVLELASLGIKLEPLLIGRLRDTVGSNAGRVQPVANSIDGAGGWGKQAADLLWSVVLSVARGFMMGAGQRSVRQQPNFKKKKKKKKGLAWSLNIHCHQEIISNVQIGLSQSDSHGEHGSLVHPLAIAPRGRDGIATLVDDVARIDAKDIGHCEGQQKRPLHRV